MLYKAMGIYISLLLTVNVSVVGSIPIWGNILFAFLLVEVDEDEVVFRVRSVVTLGFLSLEVMLKHFFFHFPPNSKDNECWVAELNAALCQSEKKRKYSTFYFLEWELKPQPISPSFFIYYFYQICENQTNILHQFQFCLIKHGKFDIKREYVITFCIHCKWKQWHVYFRYYSEFYSCNRRL